MKTRVKLLHKSFAVVLAVLMMLSSVVIANIFTASAAEVAPTDAAHPYRLIAYVADFDWPGTYDAATDTATCGDLEQNMLKLSHINYAFGIINKTTGAVSVPSPDKLRSIVRARDANYVATGHYTNILLSIGGWGMDGFAKVANNDNGMLSVFAKSCKQVMDEYYLDGIDLDWEYPGTIGDNMEQCFTYGPDVDGRNQVTLYKTVRQELTWNKLLTIACGVGYDWMIASHNNEHVQYLDLVNVMCYDIWGEYVDAADYNCNLYPSQSQLTARDDGWGGQTKNFLSVDFVCERLAERGYPKQIMNVGFPFYGRNRYATFDPAQNKYVYDTAISKGDSSWIRYNALKKLIDQSGVAPTWDSTAQASYWQATVNGKKYNVTFDDIRDIQAKITWLTGADNATKYCAQTGNMTQVKGSGGYGGAMFWEYNQDKMEDGSHPLLDALYNGLKAKGNAPSTANLKRYENTTGKPWWTYDFEDDDGRNANVGDQFYFDGYLYTVKATYASRQIYYIAGWKYAAPRDTAGFTKATSTSGTATARNEFSKEKGYTAKQNNPNPFKIASVVPNKTQSALNSPITWTVNVTGGSGNYDIVTNVLRLQVKYGPLASAKYPIVENGIPTGELDPTPSGYYVEHKKPITTNTAFTAMTGSTYNTSYTPTALYKDSTQPFTAADDPNYDWHHYYKFILGTPGPWDINSLSGKIDADEAAKDHYYLLVTVKDRNTGMTAEYLSSETIVTATAPEPIYTDVVFKVLNSKVSKNLVTSEIRSSVTNGLITPVLVGGKTMIPLRCLATVFGATSIVWNSTLGPQGGAEIAINGVTLSMPAGEMYFDKKNNSTGVTERIVITAGNPPVQFCTPNDIYIPLRSVTEATGYKVDWQGQFWDAGAGAYLGYACITTNQNAVAGDAYFQKMYNDSKNLFN